MFIITAMVIAIISAAFWILEIHNGISNSNTIIQKAEGNILKTIIAGPKIMLSFWPFAADLLISSFFLGFFGIAGSVTGMIVGLAVSDVFSIWICLKALKSTNKMCLS